MSDILPLLFSSKEITVYCGLFILITGMIGGILNVIIFTTLKTFRQTTCAFYLTFASIVGMGQMMTALLVQILSGGFLVDPTKISWFCKINYFAGNWCFAVWITSVCLATIDQYLSMSEYRHFSNLRLAQRFIIITCIFWSIHSLFILIYWDAPSGVCMAINPIYGNYYSKFTVPVLYGCLPISIMSVFSILAFYNARTLASRHVNIVRSNLDRQLTAMILIYVIYIVIAIIPFFSFYIYILNIYTTDPEQLAYNALIFTITILTQYSMFAVCIIID